MLILSVPKSYLIRNAHPIPSEAGRPPCSFHSSLVASAEWKIALRVPISERNNSSNCKILEIVLRDGCTGSSKQHCPRLTKRPLCKTGCFTTTPTEQVHIWFMINPTLLNFRSCLGARAKVVSHFFISFL